MDFQMISAIGLPLLLAIGGFAAWWAKRNELTRPTPGATWRDASLDDWRKERDEQLEAERAQRQTAGGGTVGDEGVGQEQEETKRHQRIGG